MDPAAIGLLGVVVGAFISALAGEWRARNDERRTRKRTADERIVAWQRQRIDATRRYVAGHLRELEALAVGDAAAARAAQDSQGPTGQATLSLIADEGLIGEFQTMVIELQQHLGKGLTADKRRGVIVLSSNLLRVLEDQEERAIRGLLLNELPEDAYARLFGAEEMASRIRIIDRGPSLSGRLAGALFRLHEWRTRRRRHTRAPVVEAASSPSGDEPSSS
jgi:hypothetical protein